MTDLTVNFVLEYSDNDATTDWTIVSSHVPRKGETVVRHGIIFDVDDVQWTYPATDDPAVAADVFLKQRDPSRRPSEAW